jgi:hypothetical protein
MPDDILQPGAPMAADQNYQYVADPAGGQPLQFIPDNQFVPDEYNTVEQLKGIGESFGRGAIPGFTAIEKGLGVRGEDILRRQKAISGPTDMLASTLGFIAPTIMTGGASALGKIGLLAPETVAAAKAASGSQLFQSNLLHGLAEAGTKGITSQIAKQAVSGAIEASLFSAGDEAHKMLVGDDDSMSRTAMQSAISRIGANALFGGALGTVSGLWAARNASKVAEQLKNVTEEAESTTPQGFFDAATKDASPKEKQGLLEALKEQKENAPEILAAGAEIGAPVLEGMTAKSKFVQDIDSSLTNDASFFGASRQSIYTQGFDAANKAVKEAMTSGLPAEMSQRDLGETVVNKLSDHVSNLYGPVEELHDLIKQSTPVIEVNPKSIKRVANNLLDQNVVRVTQSSPAASFIRKVAADLHNVTNVDELRAVLGSLKEYVGENPTLAHFASDIRDRLKNLEVSSIEAAGKKLLVPNYQAKQAVADLLSKIRNARELYAPFKGDLVVAAKGLGLGKVEGVSDFLYKLQQAKPETIINRIFAKDNARFLEFFSDRYPEIAKSVMDFKKGELLDEALKTGDLKFSKIFNDVEKLSPEQFRAMFSDDQAKKLLAAKTWIQAVPKNINPSGTTKAAAFNEFWRNMLSAVSITAGDSAKLAFLKFLKSEQPINASGFKAAVDYFNHATGGMTDMQKAARDIFRGAKIVIPEKQIDRNSSLVPLDNRVKSLQQKPEKHFEMAGELPHYLPNHGMALTETTTNVANYLNSQRPMNVKQSMLDKEMPPTPEKQNAYYRTLEIAQQPMVVLQRVQNGTLQLKDAIDLNRMYPDLHSFMGKELMNAMIEHTAQGNEIPFQTKKALSILMGQPLDSTLTPQSIQLAQSVYAPMQPQGMMPQQKFKKSANALTKLHRSYETTNEARLNDKLRHG